VKKKKESKSPTAALAERIEEDLGAIRRALRGPLETAAARGRLTMPQTAVMRLVVRSPGIVLRDLSREVSLAHSTVSGIVDRLEKRGLIQRRPDPADGRAMRIFPTAAVTSFVREQIPRLARGPLEAALVRAGKAERSAIAQALGRLRELLDSV
jgi:DNA-binding MarR family transcriptional regulator